MSDESPTAADTTDEESEEVFEQAIAHVAEFSDVVMESLEVLTALLMLALFAVGVYDLGLKLFTLFEKGTFTDPNNVVKLIDTALLLLIIVEVYRTVVAYIEDLNILPLVIHVGMIAMARKIISFRVSKYGVNDALLAALAYGFLMLVLVASFFILHRGQEITDFDVYSEPFSTGQEREITQEALETTEEPSADRQS